MPAFKRDLKRLKVVKAECCGPAAVVGTSTERKQA
jgi:hypothetical protein